MNGTRIRYVLTIDNDVYFYSTKERAENAMEAIDVENNEYRGFDSEGRLLRIYPSGSIGRIELAEEQPHHTAELRELLQRYLSLLKGPVDTGDLRSLLERCEPYVDESYQPFRFWEWIQTLFKKGK
jgi:hypothetical protein